MIRAFALILGYELAGEGLARLFDLTVPGAVIGLVLLFLTLCILRRLPEDLEVTAGGLHAILGLFFVPAGVGVIMFFDRIALDLVPIVLALTVGTMVTMLVTVLVFRALAGKADAS